MGVGVGEDGGVAVGPGLAGGVGEEGGVAVGLGLVGGGAVGVGDGVNGGVGVAVGVGVGVGAGVSVGDGSSVGFRNGESVGSMVMTTVGVGTSAIGPGVETGAGSDVQATAITTVSSGANRLRLFIDLLD